MAEALTLISVATLPLEIVLRLIRRVKGRPKLRFSTQGAANNLQFVVSSGGPFECDELLSVR